MKAKLWVLRTIFVIGTLLIGALIVMKFIEGEKVTVSNWLSAVSPLVALIATFIPDISGKKKKQYEKGAERYLDHAFDGHKKEKAQFMRGFSFWNENKYPQAIDALERLCKMTDDAAILARAKAHIGRCYLDAQEYENAVASYEEALSYDSSFVLAWSNLATAYDRAGEEPMKSVRALENAIFYEPDYEIAYNKLSMYYSMAQNSEKSEWAARNAIRLNPKRPENYSNLTWTLCVMGRAEEAEEMYRKALSVGYKDNGSLAQLVRNTKTVAAPVKPQASDDGVLGALRQAKYNHDHGIGGPLDEEGDEEDGDY